jgi:hypothetical protein
MYTNEVIILARRHLNNGAERSGSARLCLADAVKLQAEGKLAAAKKCALKSLAYSVGISHDDYKRANS